MSERVQSEAPTQANQKTAPTEKEPFDKRIKRFFESRFSQVNIGHLLILLLGLHLFAMAFPNQSSATVFDESYYVKASKDLLNFVPSNIEHPFFGKIWGAIGIYLFGNDFFGWRIFYVIFGVLSVWVFYEIACLFFSKEKALFAASMLGFETLFFIHTSLLLLEGPPIFFALVGFLAYFKKHYYWAALAFGLSILSKEWGIYFVGALLLYHIWATKRIPLKSLLTGQGLKKLIVFIVIVAAIVALPLWAYDAAYHPYTTTVIISPEVVINPTTNSTTTMQVSSTHTDYFWNPVQNFLNYYRYHTSLVISPQDQQNKWDHYAWGWILPFNIDPAPYYVTTITVTTTTNNVSSSAYYHPIDWLGIGNLVIWYSIWVIVPVLIIKIFTRKITELDALIGTWIAATYGPSLLLSGLFHRVVYAFYFINVDPALALGIPMVITFIAPDTQKLQRVLMAIWFAAAVVFFILFFPIHPLDFR